MRKEKIWSKKVVEEKCKVGGHKNSLPQIYFWDQQRKLK